MKTLMLGNQAVARGLYESGCAVVSSYPGTPSTEVTEYASRYEEIYCEWAPNEKVAAEVALGASIGGKRAFCAMKHVGLNVAADPLFTASYTGVNAGLIIAVADDPGMHSSQNEQDSRHYAIAAKLPMLEPSDSAECIDYIAKAYELSEAYDTPVLFRLCTRVSHSQSLVTLQQRVEPARKEYQKDIAKYVMMPAMAKRKHPVVEARQEKLAELAETSPLNQVILKDRKIGIITAGISYQYAREVFGDHASYLKLGMVNPLPTKLIQDFAEQVEQLYVIEELDDVIETHCQKIGVKVIGKERFSKIGEFSQKTVAATMGLPENEIFELDETIPVRPPVMCAGCPHRGMFYVLSKLKLTVFGDIGCYTLGAQAPLAAIDTTICMGASVSGLHGFQKARPDDVGKSVCVIGDSTFIHSGVTGLINTAYNQGCSTVIILDNSITGMTGHQQNPTTGYTIKGDPTSAVDLEALCRAVGIKRVRVVDPHRLAEVEQALKEETAANEPSVIIARRPCALLKYVKHNLPLQVDQEKCKGCKACLKVGCPALSIKNGKAVIDTTQCVGCNLCQQMCKFDCITQA